MQCRTYKRKTNQRPNLANLQGLKTMSTTQVRAKGLTHLPRGTTYKKMAVCFNREAFNAIEKHKAYLDSKRPKGVTLGYALNHLLTIGKRH
ncbi:hypothetical protein SOPP22_10940 [Shewanella sp. OPT22]|nr:hypothetical protein SOPP22_10940 [Shewanella sp. OPT22]